MSGLAIITFSLMGIYVSIAVANLSSGCIEYSVYRDNKDSDEYKHGLQMIRTCLIWPIVYAKPAARFIADLTKDLRKP